jgi:hypothetical protein
MRQCNSTLDQIYISWLCFVRPALQSRRKMRGARIVYSDRRRSGLHEALHNRAVAVSMRISSRSTKQTACLRHSSCQINLASVHNPAICLHPGIQSQTSVGTFGVGALKQARFYRRLSVEGQQLKLIDRVSALGSGRREASPTSPREPGARASRCGGGGGLPSPVVRHSAPSSSPSSPAEPD